MNAKLKRPALICAIVFAVLLILYFAVIRPLTTAPSDEGNTPPPETVEGEVLGANDRYLLFPQVERSGIQSILVENKYGTYEFYRDQNNDFQIRGYEGTPFDLTRFSSLVTSTGYTLAKVKVVDNATDAQLEEYGLADPQASWTLTTTTGQKYTVHVGYDLLTGGGYYCMLQGRRSVYVLDTTLEAAVLQPIETMCTPVLLAGITQQDYFTIDHFTVFNGEEMLCSFRIVDPEKQNNPDALVENEMVHPAPYFPNEDELYTIFYSYISLTGDSVVKLGAEEADFEACGLSKPAHTIYFQFGEAEIAMLFSEKQKGDFYYATSSLFPHEIVTVSAETMYYLEYGLLDWISPYPFQQWITAVSEMKVQGSGADVSFALTHGKTESNAATLEVQTSTGLFIPNADVYNFRQFYKTLLSIDIQGYSGLSDEEIAALKGDESKCMLTFTVTDLSGEDTVYRFYPYSSSGRRALMTVDGEGEFYVLTDLIEKIASDANKVLSGLNVDSYGKN